MVELAWTKLAGKLKSRLITQRHIQQKAAMSKILEQTLESHSVAIAAVRASSSYLALRCSSRGSGPKAARDEPDFVGNFTIPRGAGGQAQGQAHLKQR
jgi:hypothetical protein